MTYELQYDYLFDTKFEQGCKVVTRPDARGNFDGIDAEGVEVEFNTVMVVPGSIRPSYAL